MTPRPFILFTMVYGAGLATGLLHFGTPAGVGLALGPILFWRRRDLAGLLIAGILLGRIAAWVAWEREVGVCASRLPARRIELALELAEPADAEGGVLPAGPVRAGCSGLVTVRWPAGRPVEAGKIARVSGRWLPRPGVAGRPGGILLVAEVQSVSGLPGPVARLRTWLVRGTHRLYGARSPLVDALILNRRGALEPELRDRYAQSGLVHILSISGFHIGLVAAWIFLICRALGQPRERSLVVSAAGSAAYVALLGWPPPATRAAALAALLAVAQVRQRRVQPGSMLAATCLIVLLTDPWAVLDLGAWLSAAALGGATHFSRWSDRTLGEGFWWRTLASSIGATVATAPITAGALGTVALVGVALNFAAIPLAALAVPGVFASLLTLPLWPPLAEALATGAGLALNGLDLLAGAGAAVPGGHLIEAAEPVSALPWVALLGAALWGIGRGNTVEVAVRRWLCAAVAAVWVSLGLALSPTARDKSSDLTLHFLNVGQGDGAAIHTPGDHWVLVDAGPQSDRDDAGRRVVVPFLSRQGARRLSALILSHAHADHLGGVVSVLDRFPADLVMEPGELVPDSLYLHFLDALAAQGTPWRPGRPGDTFTLDGVRFTVLHPDTAWSDWGEDLNEDSVVLRVDYGAFQAVLVGDAGFRAESRLHGAVGEVDLLKVGHHGSRSATGDSWLEELRPKAAVISVGAVNRYGHPNAETLGRLAAHHATVWRTDREGEIVVATDGQNMTVRGRRGTERYSVQPRTRGQE